MYKCNKYMACITLAAFFLAVAGPVPAFAEKKSKIAVMSLKAVKVDPGLASNLTSMLTSDLAEMGKFSVMSEEDIKSIMQYESNRVKMGCSEEMTCLAEIGGALGVDLIVTGSLGKVGDTFIINLQLMNIKSVQVEARVSQTVKGQEDELINAIKKLAEKLLKGVEAAREPAGIKLQSNVNGATVIMDGRELGTTPLAPIMDIVPGKHTLKVSKDGYMPWESTIDLSAGETTTLSSNLVEIGKERVAEKPVAVASEKDEGIPLWVWIVGGVVIAGAGAGAAAAASGGSKSSSSGGGGQEKGNIGINW
jgi:TolB-like protein